MLDARITLLDDGLGIDLTLSDRFQAAGRANKPSPIYLLQHIARCQYSPARQAVYTILKERFDTEADRGESSARQAMEDFRRGPTGEEVGPRRLTASCHWDEDGACGVIALIRCFGPNADGKYGQDISQGSYNDYLSFLPKIADCLMEYAGGNPEAMLVYARFLRETILPTRGPDCRIPKTSCLRLKTNCAPRLNSMTSSTTAWRWRRAPARPPPRPAANAIPPCGRFVTPWTANNETEESTRFVGRAPGRVILCPAGEG